MRNMWWRRERGEPRETPAARFTAHLKRNMPEAGDFSHEAIQELGNPVPMLVQNGGDQLLKLWLEPFGQDYWLRPGEAVVVTSYGHWDDRPFEMLHEPDCIQVWACSWFATVSDLLGNEVPGGHQRPERTVE
ncbi:hypothetical protein BZB76_0974 [Actinomadura pelletieri DSM 43383]|uniref:Uncharacterized protein n=1 Tax=Actinomadura pelletieri DSM 43383 TaxID=1120940 RepID=A0A495QZX0_9ACTN|nr:hypothetical protein [Actinomadura pelletieri]RKS79504.1 hypothetical protein BZB76_0974 [Actinomadura pelletieri DSM 43383]